MIIEFESYLKEQKLSENTVISYMGAIKQYEIKYGKISQKNLKEYKVFLVENYKFSTVNLRIRAINCYLEFIGKKNWSLPSVKVQ